MLGVSIFLTLIKANSISLITTAFFDNSLKDFGVGYGNVAKLQSTKEGLGNLSKLCKDLRNIIKTKCDEISIQLKEEIKKLSPEEINKLTVQESCKTNSLSLEYHFSKFLLLHM